MNKKILTLSILSLFLFSMFLGFVDAAEKVYDKKVDSDCERGLIGPWLMGTSCGPGLVCNMSNKCVKKESMDMNNKIPGFLGVILDSGKSSLMYDRLIIFVLVVSVVFGVLSTVNIFGTGKGSKKGILINLIISAALGLLGIRFLPQDWISSIATPATAMVALITAGLPFLIVHRITGQWLKQGQGVNRTRTIWIAYALLILGLLVNNLAKLPAGSRKTVPIIALVCFFVLAVVEIVFASIRASSLRKRSISDVQDKAKLVESQTKETSIKREAVNKAIDQEFQTFAEGGG